MGDMESKAIFEAAQVGDFKYWKIYTEVSINQVDENNWIFLSVYVSSLIVIKLMAELR